MRMRIPIAIFALSLISSVAGAPAWAQLAVSDAPVEANTTTMVGQLNTANGALASIATADQAVAASVTTPCDAGLYTGVAQYLDGLDGLLTGAGLSPSAMAAVFAGWLPLPLDVVPTASSIATLGLGTYEAAVQVAQSQAADFDAENTYLASIESQNVGAAGVLCAMQVQTEAQLAVAAQLQMLRQLLVTSITVNALDHAETLNERAQSAATTAQAINLGVSPQ
jgi:hypothetical protein